MPETERVVLAEELTLMPAVRKLSSEYSQPVTVPPDAKPDTVSVVGVEDPEQRVTLPPVMLPEGAPLM
jgi:hypothetical protein